MAYSVWCATSTARMLYGVNGSPAITILVPAWCERRLIGRSLAALRALRWPDLQILVAAGGDDGTFAEACRHVDKRITVIEQRPGQGRQRALRMLLTHARGEIIYFLDGDSFLTQETFEALVAPLIAGTAVATTGTYRPHSEEWCKPLPLYSWSIEHAFSRQRKPDSPGLLGGNCAVLRSALLAVGGFAPELPSGGDLDLALRLRAHGFHIRFINTAAMSTYPCTVPHFLRRNSRWLRNDWRIGLRYRDRALILRTLPRLLLGPVILGPLLIPIKIGNFPIRQIRQVALFLLGVLLERRYRDLIALHRDIGVTLPKRQYILLPLLLLLDLCSRICAIYDLCLPSRRERW